MPFSTALGWRGQGSYGNLTASRGAPGALPRLAALYPSSGSSCRCRPPGSWARGSADISAARTGPPDTAGTCRAFAKGGDIRVCLRDEVIERRPGAERIEQRRVLEEARKVADVPLLVERREDPRDREAGANRRERLPSAIVELYPVALLSLVCARVGGEARPLEAHAGDPLAAESRDERRLVNPGAPTTSNGVLVPRPTTGSSLRVALFRGRGAPRPRSASSATGSPRPAASGQ